MNGDDLLLLTYRFPPTGGVGSRRWAKFSKYLSRLGWRIHVVAAEFCLDDKINWSRDVVGNDHIQIHRVLPGVPEAFLRPTRGLLMRVLRRVILKMRRRYLKAMDLAEFALPDYVSMAKKLIMTHGVRKVVVSGPPGSLFYAGALLKIDCPWIDLTLDYRDAWSQDRDFHFPEQTSLYKKERIIACEALALRVADRVVVVTEDMRMMLLRTYQIESDRVYVIHNGFDHEDYVVNDSSSAASTCSPDVVRIFYGGVLGADKGGRLLALVELAKCCEHLANQGMRFEFIIFSDLPADFFIAHESPILRYATRCSPMVDHAALVQEIISADVCLSINDRKDPHAFGTKIFDYMALGRSILHISNGGKLADLLDQSGEVTATYDPRSLLDALLELWRRHESGFIKARADVYEQFSIENLATRYDALLRKDLP